MKWIKKLITSIKCKLDCCCKSKCSVNEEQ